MSWLTPAWVGRRAEGRAGFDAGRWFDQLSSATFARVPVIVVTAENNGTALIAAADIVTTKEFVVRLLEPSTSELVSGGNGVNMRSVAIIPDAKSGIMAGSASRNDGDTITFSSPFASVPVVVCSAYDTVRKTPLRACAVRGTVSYIAIAPGILTVINGGLVPFGTGLPNSPLGLLCSASTGGTACAAAFDSQSDGGFNAVVAGDDGADPGKAGFSWVGVCVP